jgi:hypothetical protein
MLRSARTWCGVRHSVFGATAVLLWAGVAHADGAAKIDTGDTAWMLTSSALVLMMTAPGLALSYGGLVRGKNVLNLLMQSFIMIALISVQWVLWGYSLSPGSGFVTPMSALAIGAVGGVLCYAACNAKAALGWYDDYRSTARTPTSSAPADTSPRVTARSRRVRRSRWAGTNEPRDLYRRAGVDINGIAAPARTQPEGHS